MLKPEHKYSQHADKLTQFLFFATSLAIILAVIAEIILKDLWFLLIIVFIIVFWGIFSALRPSVPVFDLTDQILLHVNNKEWRQFKNKYPNSVERNGKS